MAEVQPRVFISYDVLSDEQALALLAEWSGQVRETLAEGARQVAEECGNLPLALTLCGTMARDGTTWPDLLDALREADLAFIEARLPNYAFPNVLRALRVSVDMLGREDPAVVGRYHDLAVFPRKAAVSEAAVLTLWCREKGFSERNARKLLTTLGRKALLTAQGDSPHRRLSFHDLQHDYLRAVAGDGIATLHGSLVEAYRSKCPGGWASGPDDGYLFQFLPLHLAQAGQGDALRNLLLDYAWIEAKLKATDAQSVVSDYDLVANDPVLSLVQRALRLSIQALSDWTHLPSQLIGRLRESDEPRVQALLDKAGDGPLGRPWLCPQTASLTAPEPVSQTFPHKGGVTALVALPDGRALSGSQDHTLRLWDLASGESRVLTGHTAGVTALAILPDGLRALSGSEDTTLALWDLESGRKLRTLRTHTESVTALALMPDGHHALSASLSASRNRNPLLWNLETGESTEATIHGYLYVRALTVLPDGRRAFVSSKDYNPDSVLAFESDLVLWDLATKSQLHTLEEDRSMTQVTCAVVAVLPDGCRALSGSWDGTLRLWDLETGAFIAGFTGDASIICVAVARDDLFVAGSESGAVHILELVG